MVTDSLMVEVAVQDCYFDETADETLAQSSLPSSEGSPPISTELWETWFQQWIQALQPEECGGAGCELSLRLTDDEEVRSLNASYRQKDQPTDVLAFAALEQDFPMPDELSETQPTYLGDIVISVDTATRQAQERGHSLKLELAWLATHGLLHLLGWDHPDDDSLTRMLQKQEELLNHVGFVTDSG